MSNKNISVNFISPKLKYKQTFHKKYTKWAKLSSLVFRDKRRDKNKIHNFGQFPSEVTVLNKTETQKNGIDSVDPAIQESEQISRNVDF